MSLSPSLERQIQELSKKLQSDREIVRRRFLKAVKKLKVPEEIKVMGITVANTYVAFEEQLAKLSEKDVSELLDIMESG